MKAHWGALAIGAIVGAALGFFVSRGQGSSGVLPAGSGTGITGTQNAPFQAKISRR